jgi:hypothetical protein
VTDPLRTYSRISRPVHIYIYIYNMLNDFTYVKNSIPLFNKNCNEINYNNYYNAFVIVVPM